MKTMLFTSVFMFMSFGLFAQTSLTQANNALVTGDSNALREIQFTDPGNAGINQLWDFSQIDYTGNNPASTIHAVPSPSAEGAGVYNLFLNENGYDYFMNSSGNRLEEWGYENKELKLILKYSDPVLKMKYPFSYGEYFSDHFIGVARYNETSIIDFFGDCTVNADAWGTLVLPDRVIRNALRVKSVKKGLQINMCGTTDVRIVKYQWYASGYRYPVLNMNIVENSSNGAAPVVTKTAFMNTSQMEERSSNLGADTQANTNDQVKPVEYQNVSVIVSPNPFPVNLTYNYLLTEPMDVSVELYDLSGKYSGWMVKNQLQAEGLHTGELDAVTYNLAPGTYFMRFTFGKQVVIRKIVKI